MTRDEILQEFEQYYAETFGDPCTSDLQKIVRRDVWLAAFETFKRMQTETAPQHYFTPHPSKTVSAPKIPVTVSLHLSHPLNILVTDLVHIQHLGDHRMSLRVDENQVCHWGVTCK